MTTRVLLIDDDEAVRNTLRDALSRAGYAVQLAAHGGEGLETLRNEGTDIVVTDIIMPEKEGIETIIAMRREQDDLPIIAISGGGRLSNHEFLSIAERIGADRSLKKPFRARELVELIEFCLAARPGGG